MRKYEEATGRVAGQYGLAEVDDDSWQEAQIELEDAVRSALGKERFAEYQISREASYRDLVRVAERHGLPRRVALETHALEKAHEEERRRLESEGLSPEESSDRLAQLEETIEKRRAALLGPAAARTYERLRSRR